MKLPGGLAADEFSVALSYVELLTAPAVVAAPATAPEPKEKKSKAEKKAEKASAPKAAAAAPVAPAPAPVPAPVVAPKAAAPAPAAVDEGDDDDWFAEDEEQTEEEKAEAAKALEEAKSKAMAKLAKKEQAQRSLCVLEIKPWDAEQDLMALFNKIKETVVRDGLKWSEKCELQDVAYGIKKICLTAVINQTLSMDAVIEEITEELFADEVQSMNLLSMSLL